MANIGRVFKDSYEKDGKKVPTIIMDIRTISFRKKFTVAVNKLKYPNGNLNDKPVQGKEDHADYHIWMNMSNRGESLPSEIVGNLKNAVSDNGIRYKRGKFFDPFMSKENIYFTLFEVDAEKKLNENHIYNVVAEPYRKMIQQPQTDSYAQPQYDASQEYASPNQNSIPITYEEIPF